MNIINKAITTIKKAFGMNEEITDLFELISTGEIDKAKDLFDNKIDIVNGSLKEWNIKDHEINKRQDKVLKDGTVVKQWKLPSPDQKKIVDSTVDFLFNEPVKLVRKSDEDTEEAFQIIKKLWEDMRMDTLNCEVSYKLFSETEAARLFVPYRDSEADLENLELKNSAKCIILAKSEGDTIYTKFDEFKVMRAIARGYETKSGKNTVEHFDIYTAEAIYYCTRDGKTWFVEQKENIIGKIPLSWWSVPQNDWHDVQPIITRKAWLRSTRADTNDYSGDPILLVKGNPEMNDAQKNTSGKIIRLREEHDDAKYIHPEMSVEMVKDERETLDREIAYYTDTPHKIDEIVNKLGTVSGKALKLMLRGPLGKAKRNQRMIAELMSREINILKAIGAKVIDTAKADQFKKLNIYVEFGNPLPDGIEELVEIIGQATFNKPALSQKAAVKIIAPLFGLDPEEVLAELNNEAVQGQED